MTEFYSIFIGKLKLLYGKYDEEKKRFEKISNSEAARDLGYSDAQFSRLIHHSATQKEYQRSIQNIDRILKIRRYEARVERDKKKTIGDWQRKPLWFILTILFFIIAMYGIFFKPTLSNTTITSSTPNRDYTLKWAFENSFVTPYIKLNQLPKNGYYPTYKYQGKWELKQPYKLPIFREKNGFHYLATNVIMYAYSISPYILKAYEYQHHEIWYDKLHRPIDSFLSNQYQLKKSYEHLSFKADSNFVKVAVVHTLLQDQFRIDSNKIYRRGKVIGRDLQFVPTKVLQNSSLNNQEIEDLQNSLNEISRNVLEDFSQPISCMPAKVPNSDFNKIKDGDTMSFTCQLTTHRYPLYYTKTFYLKNQFIQTTYKPSKEVSDSL